jgi:transcriptional regulator with XRE-family HTH domain
MPIASPAQDKIAAVGLSAIAARIEAGSTQRELAREIGVDVQTLNQWLHADPQRSARTRDALAASAEALADRGHQAIEDAAPTMAEVTRARMLDQHWRWRAAIRNPAYRERTDSTLQVTTAHTHTLTLAQLEQIAAQALPMVERVEVSAHSLPGEVSTDPQGGC